MRSFIALVAAVPVLLLVSQPSAAPEGNRILDFGTQFAPTLGEVIEASVVPPECGSLCGVKLVFRGPNLDSGTIQLLNFLFGDIEYPFAVV